MHIHEWKCPKTQITTEIKFSYKPEILGKKAHISV